MVLMDTDDNWSKRALLGMVSFYKAVITYLQDNLPLDNEHLKALTYLNPREQNSSKSKECCKTVASTMPCITGDKKVVNEWIRYQEIEINDDDIQGSIYHFWHRIFNIPDKCGDFLEVLPKMVKCALALCHSNADVERSLSTKKKMVIKSNTSLKPETLRGLRAVTMCNWWIWWSNKSTNYTGHGQCSWEVTQYLQAALKGRRIKKKRERDWKKKEKINRDIQKLYTVISDSERV